VDLYQRHRDRQDWSWPHGDESEHEFYELVKPELPTDNEQPIVLMLSVSDTVPVDRMRCVFEHDPLVYEIRARTIWLEFLRSRQRIVMFSEVVTHLLAELRSRHGQDQPVHVFSALPAPLAIQFGRMIKRFDPPLVLYEYRKHDRTFVKALTINTPSRQSHA
jgi:hypothetical protein